MGMQLVKGGLVLLALSLFIGWLTIATAGSASTISPDWLLVVGGLAFSGAVLGLIGIAIDVVDFFRGNG